MINLYFILMCSLKDYENVEVLDKIGGRENKQIADITGTNKIRNNLSSVTWNLKNHESNANSFALLSN